MKIEIILPRILLISIDFTLLSGCASLSSNVYNNHSSFLTQSELEKLLPGNTMTGKNIDNQQFHLTVKIGGTFFGNELKKGGNFIGTLGDNGYSGRWWIEDNVFFTETIARGKRETKIKLNNDGTYNAYRKGDRIYTFSVK